MMVSTEHKLSENCYEGEHQPQDTRASPDGGSAPQEMANVCSDPDPHRQLPAGMQSSLADAESDLSCRP